MKTRIITAAIAIPLLLIILLVAPEIVAALVFGALMAVGAYEFLYRTGLIRRIRRDVKKRGRSIDSVIDQYLTTVKPMHELYVEPSKKNANLIVPEGGKNLIALEMIINRIQRHIDGNAE